MKTMKKLLALALAAGMTLSLAACGGSSSSGSAPAATGSAAATADTGSKVFVYGTDANSTTFDPASDLQTNSGSFLVQAVCETLWTVDKDGNPTYKLAESADWTGDLELTIKLHDGIKFSNGNPLTSEDVLFTLQHFMDSPRTMSMVACVNFDTSTCPDDTTVVLEFNTYDASFFDTLGNYSFSILDKETYGEGGDFSDYSWLVGTGPYMLKGDGKTDKSGWEESVQYTLVRNDNYWGDTKPYYDELDCKFYSEESTRYADFQAGNLDACYLTEATYIKNLDSGAVPDAQLVQVSENAVFGFEMAASSATNGSMSDVNVRKAFALALDVPSMIDSLGEGVYKTASSLVGEDCWAYKELGVYKYDPDAAKAALAEAGYSTSNPLTIKVYAESTAWNSQLFEAAQSYEAAVGINLDLTGLADFATILPTLLAGGQDMTLGSGSNGASNDPGCLLQQFGPKSDNVLIRSVDQKAVDLFNQGSQSHDKTERTQIYGDFMQYIYDNYLFVPLYTGTKNYAVNTAHTSFQAAVGSSNTVDPTLLTD